MTLIHACRRVVAEKAFCYIRQTGLNLYERRDGSDTRIDLSAEEIEALRRETPDQDEGWVLLDMWSAAIYETIWTGLNVINRAKLEQYPLAEAMTIVFKVFAKAKDGAKP